ncbi:hypothetical protein Bca4012_067019 [Brassica carinata]
MCWIAWDKLTKPKSAGGLGIQDIHDFNIALLAKLAWRILVRPDSLLSRILLGKYCTKSTFRSVGCPQTTSHGWRGILIGRDLLESHLGKAIGNGMTTNIWKEAWVSTSTYLRPFGPPRECDQDLVVADFLTHDSAQWIVSRVEEIFPNLAAQITRIVPSRLGAHDTFCWYGTRSGIYSVKSGYLALQELQEPHAQEDPHEEAFDWYKVVWSVTTSPKLQLFLWKLCRGSALALGENLATRGLSSLTGCPHCGAFETALHLFFHCPFAIQVWTSVPIKQPFITTGHDTLSSALRESLSLICLPPTGLSVNVSSWIFWYLWYARNLLLFENRQVSARVTTSFALSSTREWQAAQHKITMPHLSSSFAVTCNTDAAWSKDTGTAGLGWVFDGSIQSAVQHMSKSLPVVSSPLMAEALAMCEAVLAAQQSLLSKVWFRSDSQ